MPGMSEKIMSLISSVRAGLDELETELGAGEGAEMEMESEEMSPEEPPMESSEAMPEDGLKMRSGMRPKKNATMDDYFSSKR